MGMHWYVNTKVALFARILSVCDEVLFLGKDNAIVSTIGSIID